ncbi:MAG: hypothetical protein EOP66_09445 [Sphingomonas sp.]|nr:MAG: hypothetical protein EOP66_09445 [Sphingomonas sp.]
MVAVLSLMIFGGAFVAAAAVIASSIAPQWQRIMSLASGNIEQGFSPLAKLATAEQRIAVRRWASAPVPAPLRRLREAA